MLQKQIFAYKQDPGTRKQYLRDNADSVKEATCIRILTTKTGTAD